MAANRKSDLGRYSNTNTQLRRDNIPDGEQRRIAQLKLASTAIDENLPEDDFREILEMLDLHTKER